MQKNKAIIIMPLLLLLGAGCVKPESQTQQTINVPVSNPTVTVGNPQSGTIPMATTCPMPQQPTTVTYPPQTYPQPVQVQPVFVEPEYIPQRTPYLQGAYARNYKLKQFITNMAQKHNFDPHELNAIFSTVNRDTIALDKYNVYKTARPSQAKTSSVGSWDKYRGNFLTSSRIKKGVAFWQENANYLNKAYQQYGIPPEYIVGVIGVETNFGGYTGKHSVLNAITTLALEYKKRSKFFTSELEHYLLVIRDEKVHPQKIKGSYAGAFGLAQFMPSSFREYAVDFNGDGHINLFNKADAIGSIANYFVGRGKWQKGTPVTMKTYYNKARFYGLPTGHKTNYTQRHMMQIGMRPTSNFAGYRGNVSLIKLSRYNRDELWWGTPNFRAITRYNPRDHYAMAVHQLAQAIKKARYGR